MPHNPPVTFNDLGLRYAQAASWDRAERWHGDTPWSLSDWMVACVGELGEAANTLKKMNRHRDGITTDRDPELQLLKGEFAVELADTLAYLLPLASAAGVDLAGAFVRKFNVVSDRQGWEDMKLDELPRSRAFS